MHIFSETRWLDSALCYKSDSRCDRSLKSRYYWQGWYRNGQYWFKSCNAERCHCNEVSIWVMVKFQAWFSSSREYTYSNFIHINYGLKIIGCGASGVVYLVFIAYLVEVKFFSSILWYSCIRIINYINRAIVMLNVDSLGSSTTRINPARAKCHPVSWCQ